MKIVKLFLAFGLAITLASCGTQKTTGTVTATTTGIQTSTDNIGPRKAELSAEELKGWPHMDIYKDNVPGMSLDNAYAFLNGKKGETVLVAVIDSGIDIEHEDLDGMVWTNPNEIAGNGIDDDKNGYVDDIHGWNFLGGEKGQACPEQLEITRIVTRLMPKYEGKTADQVADKAEFEYYTKLKKEVDKEIAESSGQKEFYTSLLKSMKATDEAVQKSLGKKVYTVDELMSVKLDDPSFAMGKNVLMKMLSAGVTPEEGFKKVEKGIDHFTEKLKYNYNLDFRGRLTKDNPYDINDKNYGNNMVIGSKDVESHGTHVAGIILAERNNGVGMNGVTNNAKLMTVRVVPDGDEYDKDVALAIRYAADNGAKVVNMSFGKSYSPYAQWVYDAIKYAESKDVLLVHAAGNDSKNIDVDDNFPNDSKDKKTEFADNVITVGAMTANFDENLPAEFSNYGKLNVDIFAPGSEIYSTVPKNEYDSYQGTSMASPEVAGVAALVRSYYPNLTAKEVKKVLMDSGIEFKRDVNIPFEDKPVKGNFTNLSVSGRILNAYNALLLADKVSKSKK